MPRSGFTVGTLIAVKNEENDVLKDRFNSFLTNNLWGIKFVLSYNLEYLIFK